MGKWVFGWIINVLCSLAHCPGLCSSCPKVARCLRSTVHTKRSKSHGGCKNIGLVETQAFMPIPNVSETHAGGFADLTYCGRPVITGLCGVQLSGGDGGGLQFSWCTSRCGGRRQRSVGAAQGTFLRRTLYHMRSWNMKRKCWSKIFSKRLPAYCRTCWLFSSFVIRALQEYRQSCNVNWCKLTKFLKYFSCSSATITRWANQS